MKEVRARRYRSNSNEMDEKKRESYGFACWTGWGIDVCFCWCKMKYWFVNSLFKRKDINSIFDCWPFYEPPPDAYICLFCTNLKNKMVIMMLILVFVWSRLDDGCVNIGFRDIRTEALCVWEIARPSSIFSLFHFFPSSFFNEKVTFRTF